MHVGPQFSHGVLSVALLPKVKLVAFVQQSSAVVTIPSNVIPLRGSLSHVLPTVGLELHESSGSVSVLLAPNAVSPSESEQQLSSPVNVPSRVYPAVVISESHWSSVEQLLIVL